MGNTLHVYFKENDWEFISRDVIDGNRKRNRSRDHFARISPEIKVCKGMCEADSDCTHASLTQIRQFMIKSARKLVVQPPIEGGSVVLFCCLRDASCCIFFVTLHCSLHPLIRLKKEKYVLCQDAEGKNAMEKQG